jgi:hypothetical protein
MAANKQKELSGVLFKNDRREKDTHPHATGSALIDGVEYWVSAWTKEGAKGKFQSLAFKRKEAKNAQGQTVRQPGKLTEDDLDVPF